MKFLVINLGLKSIRAIVFDSLGETYFQDSYTINTLVHGNEVEQDPNEWWDKMCTLLKEIGKNKELAQDIKKMTFTSSSSCLVCVDEKGEPLRNAIMVSDRRSEKEVKFLQDKGGQKVADKKVDVSLMIPKILWLKKNERKTFDRTKYFVSPNDFFIGKLTGKFVTDSYNASKYYYDQKWPRELLKLIDIEGIGLPDVKNIGTTVGEILPVYKKCFGINAEVVLTTYDAICSIFGSGICREGDSSDVSGTVTSIRTILDNKLIDPQQRIFTMDSLNKGQYIIGGSNNLGGGIIEWTKELLVPDNDDPYAQLIKEATESSPGSNGIIFLPYLLGERCPIWDPDARGIFFGLQRGHQRKQMLRSIFEGIAFNVRTMIEVFRDLDIKTNRLMVSGGLTRIRLISQIKADVLDMEVCVADNLESTALGAAIIMAVSANCYENVAEAAEKMVKIKAVFKPNKDLVNFYNDMYSIYLSVYMGMKNTYRMHRSLHDKHKVVISNYLEKLHNL